MNTNLYLPEKLPAARQRELLAEADRDLLLAAHPRERQRRMRHARGT
ncbi:MAG TPA: hypothetical protein VGJ35_15885 [Burkholderiaceae bacterium]